MPSGGTLPLPAGMSDAAFIYNSYLKRSCPCCVNPSHRTSFNLACASSLIGNKTVVCATFSSLSATLLGYPVCFLRVG